MKRITVTYRVVYEVDGELPPSDDEAFADFFAESMLDHAPCDVHLWWGDGDEEVRLDPCDWSVDCGEYGDITTERVASWVTLDCRCGDEVTVTPALLPDGWYFTTDTGWLCPTCAPEPEVS